MDLDDESASHKEATVIHSQHKEHPSAQQAKPLR